MTKMTSDEWEQAMACLACGLAGTTPPDDTGGGPRFVKVGGRVAYRRRDLERWLDARTYARTHEPAEAS
jgi:hypothetical protein